MTAHWATVCPVALCPAISRQAQRRYRSQASAASTRGSILSYRPFDLPPARCDTAPPHLTRGPTSMSTVSPAPRFPALRHRDFRTLWVGMLFASGTMAFQYYAQIWLVFSLTDSALVLGVLGATRG